MFNVASIALSEHPATRGRKLRYDHPILATLVEYDPGSKKCKMLYGPVLTVDEIEYWMSETWPIT